MEGKVADSQALLVSGCPHPLTGVVIYSEVWVSGQCALAFLHVVHGVLRLVIQGPLLLGAQVCTSDNQLANCTAALEIT